MTGKHYLPEHDAIIAQVEDRALLLLIAARLGKSEASILARWHALRAGRPTARTGYHRIWSRAEDQFLRETVGQKPIAAICEELGRTPVAVRIRAKRLGLRWIKGSKRQPGTGLTARAVALALGLSCQKTVAWWIREGFLEGTKRPVRCGTNVVWRITPEALARFLRDYRWLYDPARVVDPGWRRFVAGLPPAEYVGTREAARRLCYEEGSINQLIRRGDLPAEKHGPNWKIAERDLAVFAPPPMGWGGRKDADAIRAGLTARRTETLAAKRTTGWTRRRQAEPMAAD